MIARLVSASRS